MTLQRRHDGLQRANVPELGKAEISYPSPNKADKIVIERVPIQSDKYEVLPYHTPHPTYDETGLFLVWQGKVKSENNQTVVVRVYANDLANDDWFNGSIKFSGDTVATPIFVRNYIELRANFVAETRAIPLDTLLVLRVTDQGAYDGTGVPDVTLTGGGGTGATAKAIMNPDKTKVIALELLTAGTGYTSNLTVGFSGGGEVTPALAIATIQPQEAVLIKEEVARLESHDQLASLFVRVSRIYETLPGPWIPFTRWDDNLREVRGRRRSVLTTYDVEQTFNDGTRNYTWRPSPVSKYVLTGSFPDDPTRWDIVVVREAYGLNSTATFYEIVEDEVVGHWKFERADAQWSLIENNPEGSSSPSPDIPDRFEFINPTQHASSSPTTKTSYEARDDSAIVSIETFESWGDAPYDFEFSVEIPDRIPPEFRDLLPTRTSGYTEVGRAEPPILGPGELARSSKEENQFWRHQTVTGRDLTALPVSRKDWMLDGINAGGSEFGGIFENERTLAEGIQVCDEGFLVTESKVMDLGNNLSLKETKQLTGNGPARLELTNPGSGFAAPPAVVFDAGEVGGAAAGTAHLSTAPVIPPTGDPGGIFPLILESYGDDNGVFYLLGSRNNGGVWRNPIENQVAIRSGGSPAYPLSQAQLARVTDRNPAVPVVVVPLENGGHYLAFDLGVGRKLKANRITIRQSSQLAGTMMQSLRVEGFNDFVTPFPIGDAAIPQAAGEWSQAPLDNTVAFRYFKLYGLDGPIPGLFPTTYPALVVGEIEFYGELEITPGLTKQYSFDGDTNGVFYELGARGNGGVWRNPHTFGDIEVAADNIVTGTPDMIVDRQPSNVIQDASTFARSYYFDLKEGRSLICNKMTFFQRNLGAAACSVQLQGTNDPTFVTNDWHPLANFVTPTTANTWKTLDVPGNVSYRRFRIVTNTDHFAIGEFELYGALTFPPPGGYPPTGFSVETVEITNGGSGYATPPGVQFDGDGTGAAGVAVINDEGVVTGVTMMNHGYGYTAPPTVTFSSEGLVGGGAAATAIIDGQVQETVVDNGGSGYEVAPTVEYSGGGGSGAAGTAVVGFALESIEVTNPGNGDYSYPPDVMIDPPDAAAFARLSFKLGQIFLDDPGSGYTTPPDVVIGPPDGVGGIQATAHAVLVGDVVDSIVIDDPGYGYLDYPSVTLVGDGTGAEAWASFEDTGYVDSIVMDYSALFETVPDVELMGDGTGAAITPHLATGGSVMRIDTTDPGTNYQSPPAVALVPVGADPGIDAAATAFIEGPVTGFDVTNGGVNYETPPNVEIPGGATATANISGGQVVSLTLVDGGSGYTEPPPVVFGSLGGPEGVATIAFGVDHINMNSPGSGYAVEPPVHLEGDGRSATARAVLGRGLARIEVVAGGDNYAATINVGIHGPGGSNQGATATAQRSFGIQSVNVTNPGSGYLTDPTVTAPAPAGGIDAIFQAIRGLRIGSVVMSNSGEGYTTPPAVGFAAPFPLAGVTAAGDAVLGFGVDTIDMDNMGSGYTSAPEVRIPVPASGGGGATAIAELLGRTLATIFVDNGGSGYTTPPTIVIGNGSNATAHAVLTGDVITSIVIDSPGSGYVVAPEIHILNDGGGTGAHAQATLTATQDIRIVVTNPGLGYEEAPAVELIGGGGTGAAATATLKTTGSVKRVDLTEQGSQYTTNTPVTFTGGGGTGAAGTAMRDINSAGSLALVAVLLAGSGYIAATINCVITGGGGSGATALAIKNTLGQIKSITLTNPGSNFEAPPVVSIGQAGGGIGTGAVLRAILLPTGGVKRVQVTSEGEGYTEPPIVTFPAGDGSGAAATAFLTDTGSIETLTLTVPGGPFSVPPTVSFVPPGDEPIATALYILPQSWPTLIDEITDPTDKLIVVVTKDIKPYGTALPPGYSEMQALNKYRSIQMVSKIDLTRLPPVEEYLTTQNVSLPNELLSVTPVWSKKTGYGTAVDNYRSNGSVSADVVLSGSILVLKTGGFRGAAISRVQRVHFRGIPPDSAVPLPTIIRPSTGTAYLKGGSMSEDRSGEPDGPLLNLEGQPAQPGDVIGYNAEGQPLVYGGSTIGPIPNQTTKYSTSVGANLQIVDINDVLTAGIHVRTVNGVTQEADIDPVVSGDFEFGPGLRVRASVEGEFGVSMPASCPASLTPGSTILQEVGVEKRRFGLYVRSIIYVIVPGMCDAVGGGS